ncbi:MAG: molecular chaperone DnaJ, partial [Gemmatimonadales bacterium]
MPMSAQTKDFYKILGVSEKADTDEIRKAYRKLAKKYHPDANQGDEKAAERFKAIGEAYGVLSNAEKRKQYDQMRKFGAFGMGGRARGGGPARPGATRPGPGGAPGDGAQGFSFDDLGGLGDIFSSIFDRGRRGAADSQRSTGPQKGPDTELSAEISFKLAVQGGKLNLKVPITESCATCGGAGARPGTRLTRCEECTGSGSVSFGQGGFAVNRPCPACGGR